MKEVRDEWINRFNSLEFDEQKSKDFVDFLYELSGNKKPIKVVLGSPFALQIACSMNKKSQVESQVESQVWSQVGSQVLLQVRSQVKSQVLLQVRSQVRLQVKSQVWSQVGSQVESQVQTKDKEFFLEASYGRCDDAAWVSFFDFFEKIGILKNKLFSKYKELLKGGLFCFIAQKDIAYLSKPPIFLGRDENGAMHCLDDYAVAFTDGWGLHYVHGVYFSKDLFQKAFQNKTITAEEILQLENAEQKAVIMKEFGYEKIINSLKEKKIIDAQTKFFNRGNKEVEYQLIEIPVGNLKAKFLKVEWWGKGIKRQTVLGVPPESKDAISAVAWTCYKTKKEYEKEMLMEA